MARLAVFSLTARSSVVQIVAAAAVGAVLTVLLLPLRTRDAETMGREQRESSTEDEDARRQLSQLSRKLSELQARVSRTEALAATGAANAPASGPRVEAEGGARSAPPPELAPKEHDELMVDFSRQTFEDRLREEPVDPEWAPAKERAITSAFAERYTSRLVSVSCASTLCRTVVDHGNEEERQPFLQSFFGDTTFGTSCWFMRLAEGTGTELFCAREGQALPRVDPALLR